MADIWGVKGGGGFVVVNIQYVAFYITAQF